MIAAFVLPYVTLPDVPLPFGVTLHPFGVFAAAGVFVGSWLAERAARRSAPGTANPLRAVPSWALVGGLIGGHLLHLLAYHPEELRADGWASLFTVWNGLSSMGGVLGGLAAIVLWFRVKHLPLLPWLDAIALGVAPGWAIARIGCAVVHDHPGIRSTSMLAVAFPDGPRFDLGLLDALVLGLLSLVLYALPRRRPAPGTLMGVLAVVYGTTRFLLDFLRASDLAYVDARYRGLTPAQFIAPCLVATGVVLLLRNRRRTDLTSGPISAASS